MFLRENTNQDAVLGASTDFVSPSYAGIIDAVRESDEAWGNLVSKVMRLEHHAIVTENAQLLQEGFKEFWAKVLKGLETLWNKIRNFFVGLFNWIKGKVQGDETFLKDNLSKINELTDADLGDWKVSIRKDAIDKMASGAFLSAISNAMSKVKPKILTGSTAASESFDLSEADTIGGTEVDEHYYRREIAAAVGASYDKDKGNFSSAVEEALIGKENAEVKIDAAFVKGACVKAMQNFPKFEQSYKAALASIQASYNSAKAIATNAAGMNQGDAKTNQDKSYRSAESHMKSMSSFVGLVNGFANNGRSQARSLAQTALSKKGSKKEEKQSASSSILDMYS